MFPLTGGTEPDSRDFEGFGTSIWSNSADQSTIFFVFILVFSGGLPMLWEGQVNGLFSPVAVNSSLKTARRYRLDLSCGPAGNGAVIEGLREGDAGGFEECH